MDWHQWHMEQNGEGGEKVRSRLKPFVDQSSSIFWTIQETLRTFQRPCPIVNVTFRSEDIRH